jgi:hypothetical protein
MSSIYPDNSTECLLRAILNAQPPPAYDWSPPNFAFTAAIGVVALAIAITTVFLNAGPGNLEGLRRLKPPSGPRRRGLALGLTGESYGFVLLL